MTDYGKPQRATTVSNISRSPSRPFEQSARLGVNIRLPHATLVAPKTVAPPSVSKPAAVSKEMTPMRRDLEARAKALANRPPQAVASRPVSVGRPDPEDDSGPSQPRPGGVKVR